VAKDSMRLKKVLNYSGFLEKLILFLFQGRILEDQKEKAFKQFNSHSSKGECYVGKGFYI